jgi:hypothetical protein
MLFIMNKLPDDTLEWQLLGSGPTARASDGRAISHANCRSVNLWTPRTTESQHEYTSSSAAERDPETTATLLLDLNRRMNSVAYGRRLRFVSETNNSAGIASECIKLPHPARLHA